MYESYHQAAVVFMFYGRCHELLTIVLGVPGRFPWPVRPDTYLRDTTKKLVIFAVYVRLHELCPLCWGFRAIYTHQRPDTCFRVMTKTTLFSRFMAVFMSNWPQFGV